MRLFALACLMLVAGCVAPGPSEEPSPAAAGASPEPAVAPLAAPTQAAPAPAPPACPAGLTPEAFGCGVLLGEPDAHNLEPSLAVDPADPRRALVAWTVREVIREAGVSLGTRAHVEAAMTEDGGATWTVTRLRDERLDDKPGTHRYAFDQRAFIGPDGTAYVAFLGEATRMGLAGDGIARITLASSDDGGRTWRTTRVAELPGVRFDYLALAQAPDTGALYLATDEQVSRGVWVFRSGDGGASWSEPVPAHAGPAPHGYHGFPALAAFPGDRILLTTTVQFDPEAPDARGLALAVSRDGGATFEAPTPIVSTPYDALPAMPLASTVLADGTARAVALIGHAREGLHAVETRDGGLSWSPPRPLSPGRPVWAVVALAADGSWATLQRDDVEETSAYTLLVARTLEAPETVPVGGAAVPFGGQPGDDYGGLAFGADGTIWAAHALENAGGSRIAVHLLPPPG